MLAQVYFWVFFALALGTALYLLTTRHPLSGAMALIGNMMSLAGIYSLLDAPFLGVVQVLVYAGAIMMLVVFVIMVVNGAHDHDVPQVGKAGLAMLLIPATLCAMLMPTLLQTKYAVAATAAPGTIANISALLFNTSPSGSGFPVLFELTGLILLSAMVAAVVLAKQRLEGDSK